MIGYDWVRCKRLIAIEISCDDKLTIVVPKPKAKALERT